MMGDHPDLSPVQAESPNRPSDKPCSRVPRHDHVNADSIRFRQASVPALVTETVQNVGVRRLFDITPPPSGRSPSEPTNMAGSMGTHATTSKQTPFQW
jgi:hypothetical protein